MNQTPQEYADALIEKYSPIVMLPPMTEEIVLREATKCALIDVQNTIDILDEIFDNAIVEWLEPQTKSLRTFFTEVKQILESR